VEIIWASDGVFYMRAGGLGEATWRNMSDDEVEYIDLGYFVNPWSLEDYWGAIAVEGTPIAEASSRLTFKDGSSRLEEIDGTLTRHVIADVTTVSSTLAPWHDPANQLEMWISTDATPTVHKLVVKGTWSGKAGPQPTRVTPPEGVTPGTGESQVAASEPYTLTWTWSRFNEDFGEIGLHTGGQGQQTPLSADPNIDELVNTALDNMAALGSYGVDLVAVEPSDAITPTSHFTLTGSEQPGKGVVLTARGTNSVSTYSIVSIQAMTAAEFPYELIAVGEDLYISTDRGNTWKMMSDLTGSFFIPPTLLLCTWGSVAGTGTGQTAWIISSCADMIRNAQLEDGEPKEETVSGVPARHLTGNLMAGVARSGEMFKMPYVYNDSPEALVLHVWISTDATPRVVRMRLDLTSSQQKGEGVTAPFLAVAFSPDGKLLAGAHMSAATGSPGLPQEEGTLMVWDLTRSDSPAIRLGKWYGDHFWDVEFSPDGKVLAAAGSRGIAIWEVTNLGADPTILTIPGNVSLPSIAFSADSRMLGVAGSPHGIYVWDAPYQDTPRLLVSDPAGSVAFSLDGRTLATSGTDGVRLYSIDDLKAEPRVLNAPEAVPPGAVHYRNDALAFSPDGQLLAVSRDPDGGDSAMGQVDVWDLGSLEKPLATLPGSGGVVAFSPDGKYLATEGGQVWEVAAIRSEGAKASPLLIEGICGNAPAFSPDSRKLAVACYENAVQVWDVTDMAQAGKPIVLLRDPADTNKLTYSLTWTWSRFNDDSIEVKPPAPETIKQP
jgi:WD40 repeat protein